MKKFTFLTILIIFLSFILKSQTTGYDYLNINNVKARINAHGNNFWDQSTGASFEVPNGSGKTSIFNQTIWLGGMDTNGTVYAAAETNRLLGEDFWPGPIADVYDAAYDLKWNIVWKINKSSIDSIKYLNSSSGTYPIQVPASVLNWPAHGDTTNGESYYLAPFYDNDNDGNYDPTMGDYPIIKGDQAIYYIINDERYNHSFTGGNKLKFEIHVMVYAYNCTQDSAFQNTVFINYKVFNRSGNRYTDFYTGVFTDFDLGDKTDDYIGCDVEKGLYFAYNGDSLDGDGLNNSYGSSPPAMGIKVLASAYMDPDDSDNAKYDANGNIICDVGINGFNFGDGKIDNERFGMRNFFYYSGLTDTSNDYTATQCYNMLKGYHPDSNKVLYGGNGYNTAAGAECDFMYPADTDPCNWGTGGIQPTGALYWTEKAANNNPGDRVGLTSAGPFTFEVDACHEIDLAIIWARANTGDPYQSVLDLKRFSDTLTYFFINDTVPCPGSNIGINYHIYNKNKVQELSLSPNPANSTVTIDWGSTAYPCNYEIINLIGQSVSKGVIANSSENQITVSNLEEGIYILKMQSGEIVQTKKFVKKK